MAHIPGDAKARKSRRFRRQAGIIIGGFCILAMLGAGLLSRNMRPAFCILAMLGAGLLSRNMRPALQALAEARIRSIAARAMNDAILESMGNAETYAQLISVRENGDKVYLLQANTRNMNILAADCAEAAQDRIAQIGERRIVRKRPRTGSPKLESKAFRSPLAR